MPRHRARAACSVLDVARLTATRAVERGRRAHFDVGTLEEVTHAHAAHDNIVSEHRRSHTCVATNTRKRTTARDQTSCLLLARARRGGVVRARGVCACGRRRGGRRRAFCAIARAQRSTYVPPARAAGRDRRPPACSSRAVSVAASRARAECVSVCVVAVAGAVRLCHRARAACSVLVVAPLTATLAVERGRRDHFDVGTLRK